MLRFWLSVQNGLDEILNFVSVCVLQQRSQMNQMAVSGRQMTFNERKEEKKIYEAQPSNVECIPNYCIHIKQTEITKNKKNVNLDMDKVNHFGKLAH